MVQGTNTNKYKVQESQYQEQTNKNQCVCNWIQRVSASLRISRAGRGHRASAYISIDRDHHQKCVYNWILGGQHARYKVQIQIQESLHHHQHQCIWKSYATRLKWQVRHVKINYCRIIFILISHLFINIFLANFNMIVMVEGVSPQWDGAPSVPQALCMGPWGHFPGGRVLKRSPLNICRTSVLPQKECPIVHVYLYPSSGWLW